VQVTELSLTNFRSYRQLDLPLGPGLTTVVGANAQGKSNLLEALYLLAIGKSYRAPVERDLVAWEAADAGAYAIIAATLRGREGPVEVRVGPNGRLFGSVTGRHIAERLTAATGRAIDHRQVLLGAAIHEPGDYPVSIRLYREVTAEVTVSVVPEGYDPALIAEADDAAASGDAAEASDDTDDTAEADETAYDDDTDEDQSPNDDLDEDEDEPGDGITGEEEEPS
jgi:hypothetical protein